MSFISFTSVSTRPNQLSILKGPQRVATPSKLVHRIFEENLARIHSQSRVALIYVDDKQKETRLLYSKLNAKANQIAYKILSMVHTRDPNPDGDYVIAVCMEPSINLIITFLAILKTGAAYLPLDINCQVNRIMALLNESKPILIIYDENFNYVDSFGDKPHVAFNKLYVESENMSTSNILKKNALGKEVNDIALILYSGAAAALKGARIPHSNVFNRLKWQYDEFPYSSTEQYAIFKTAFTFIDSVPEMWGPLLNGLTLIIVPPKANKDPAKLVQVLENYKIERIVLVPTLLSNILLYLSMNHHGGEVPKLLENLGLWISSGEALPTKLVQQFFEYFDDNKHRLCNFYGTTEVMGDVTYYVFENKDQLKSLLAVPIGKPIDNTIIYILDRDYRPVRNDQVGEIFISGLNLSKGYVKNREPEKFIVNPFSVDKFHSHIYRTGDFATLNNGLIFYEGRADSQIKVRGHRIDLTEVQHYLSNIEEVDNCCVISYHPGEMDQALIGFVTLRSDSYAQSFEIEKKLNKVIPSYTMPEVKILKSFPFLFNGKIDRDALLEIYENSNLDASAKNIDYDYSGVPTHELDMARDLFETIGQMINHNNKQHLIMTKESNFFEIGGDASNTLCTITQLQNKGYDINITSFVAAENLGQLLTRLSDGTSKIELPTLIRDLNKYCQLDMRVLPIEKKHKTETIDIISSYLYEKGPLVHFLKPQLQKSDTGVVLDTIWDDLIEKDLSFLVKDQNDRTVGVALNFDARDEPVLTSTSHLKSIFEILGNMEGPIKDLLPLGQNQILHSFLIGTHPDLTSKEFIGVVIFIEYEIVEMAKRRNFAGVFSTNASPLLQQLYSQVYGYQNMKEVKPNQYVDHTGAKPFVDAPDSLSLIVYWKDLTH